MSKTINYYNQHALDYFVQTFDLDNSLNQKMFMHEVKKVGYTNPKMLDIGCGACRDTFFFNNNGISVYPIDASDELAAIVKEQLDIDIHVMNMSNMSFNQEFELVWASASILHLDKEEAKSVMAKCYNALKTDGLFYISVKAKQDEEFSDGERYFSYYEKDELSAMLEDIGFTEKSFWYNCDNLGRPTIWLNFVVQK